jgi:hypothetical protein
MDERLQFVARRLAGEPMAELCRALGISRKTGHKIFDRYQECGVHGRRCGWWPLCNLRRTRWRATCAPRTARAAKWKTLTPAERSLRK